MTLHPLVSMILHRLALGLLTLFAISLFIFFAIELLPGDLAEEVLGQSATPETVEAFRRELGLDQPAMLRYFNWLGGVVRGDFGTSLANGRDIAELLAGRFANTLFLAIYAAAIAVPLSITLGLLAALYRGSWFDRAVNILTLTSISFPEYFVAYILLLYFSVTWGLFPSIADFGSDADLSTMLFRTFLPALTLVLVVTAHMMRMTRAAIINLLAQPYIEMARLKGASPVRVILRHALPNALAPIVNVVALNLAYLVTGVVIVEVVFVYPGLGQLMVDSVAKRDIPVVQACCLIFAGIYILLNLGADVLAIATNPRLMHRK
ncbi:ABC transporter permease [Thalassovita aquimarina]|uniref:ABC transporter permease n=1 Tax=Thalassovita aquimarina TaxID=2785917 RepID=A0ABS5HWB5_9RHOB|nr:ABC transporter permease [Thalassovita aquimarina]MBR9653290.1 ABC transporter permease [Thalassovita aquimarina]